jgi:hypothetical protein
MLLPTFLRALTGSHPGQQMPSALRKASITLSGLEISQAEQLLDWLENNGYPGAKLSSTPDEEFTVAWTGSPGLLPVTIDSPAASPPALPLERPEARPSQSSPTPAAWWQDGLLDALLDTIGSHDLSAPPTRGGSMPSRSLATNRWRPQNRPRLTVDDVRLHAWIAERVAGLPGERPSWRRTVRRILGRIPLVGRLAAS